MKTRPRQGADPLSVVSPYPSGSSQWPISKGSGGAYGRVAGAMKTRPRQGADPLSVVSPYPSGSSQWPISKGSGAGAYGRVAGAMKTRPRQGADPLSVVSPYPSGSSEWPISTGSGAGAYGRVACHADAWTTVQLPSDEGSLAIPQRLQRVANKHWFRSSSVRASSRLYEKETAPRRRPPIGRLAIPQRLQRVANKHWFRSWSRSGE